MEINVGDRFVRKNTRDSEVYEVCRIESSFSQVENVYELMSVKLHNRMTIGEEALLELYNKLETK